MSTNARAGTSPALTVRRPLITAPREIGWATMSLPPAPGPGQVRVRTRVTLISPGTELRLFRGDPMAAGLWEAFADLDAPLWPQGEDSYRVTPPNLPSGPIYPATFGYNNVGEVVALGEGVELLAVGDRVRTAARHQEVYDARAWEAVKIPDTVSDEAAAFSYVATLGLHALRRARFAPGENVAVVGLGLVGLCAALVADACGACLACLDIDADRRRVTAAALPDAIVLDPLDPGFAGALERSLRPHGVDLVIEAGAGAASLDLAMRLLDGGGRLAVVALHPEEVGPLLSSDFYTKEAAVLGTSNDPYEDPRLRRNRFTIAGNLSCLLDLQRRGRLPLERVLTHAFPVSKIDEAYAELASGRRDMVGVLLEWS